MTYTIQTVHNCMSTIQPFLNVHETPDIDCLLYIKFNVIDFTSIPSVRVHKTDMLYSK